MREWTYKAHIATSPIKGDFIAGISIRNERRWSSVNSTVDRRVVGALDWADVSDLANDTWIGFAVRDIAFEGLAVHG